MHCWVSYTVSVQSAGESDQTWLFCLTFYHHNHGINIPAMAFSLPGTSSQTPGIVKGILLFIKKKKKNVMVLLFYLFFYLISAYYVSSVCAITTRVLTLRKEPNSWMSKGSSTFMWNIFLCNIFTNFLIICKFRSNPYNLSRCSVIRLLFHVFFILQTFGIGNEIFSIQLAINILNIHSLTRALCPSCFVFFLLCLQICLQNSSN